MIQQLLFAGQVLVIVLVYLFVWRVMRTARGDLRDGTGGAPGAAPGAVGSLAAQESTIIPAADVAAARRRAGLADPRIVVATSEVLREGVPFTVGREGLTLGRSADNDVVLEDSFVSGHHARVIPPSTLVDLDSTNGTLVNGRALHGRVRLKSGDSFQLGSTVFRFEAPS